MKQKIIDHFKPSEGNIWRTGFLILLFANWVGPFSIVWLNMLRVGILAPTAVVDFEEIATKLTNQFIPSLESIHSIGVKLGTDSPFIAGVLEVIIASWIWAFYLLILYFLADLVKTVVWHVKTRKEKKQ